MWGIQWMHVVYWMSFEYANDELAHANSHYPHFSHFSFTYIFHLLARLFVSFPPIIPILLQGAWPLPAQFLAPCQTQPTQTLWPL